MNKKSSATVIILCFLLSGCRFQASTQATSAPKATLAPLTPTACITQTVTTIIPQETTSIPPRSTQVPLEQVQGISIEEAEDLCYETIGEFDEDTGFELSYRCIEAVKIEDATYYVMFISWLVDNDHWSHIGHVLVSADGAAIYSCTPNEDGSYTLDRKLWGK